MPLRRPPLAAAGSLATDPGDSGVVAPSRSWSWRCPSALGAVRREAVASGLAQWLVALRDEQSCGCVRHDTPFGRRVSLPSP
jgi:hypothetical protein